MIRAIGIVLLAMPLIAMVIVWAWSDWYSFKIFTAIAFGLLVLFGCPMLGSKLIDWDEDRRRRG